MRNKRTYEQALSFFRTRKTKERGLGRELYITRHSDIEKIIRSLLKERPHLKERIWVDPCAGDGRWLDVARGLGVKNTISFDIEPLNDGVKEQDFFKLEKLPSNTFIIGNPPFSLAHKFIEKALELTDVCYFLGGSQRLTGNISSRCELLHRFEGYEGNQKDKRSKLTFGDTNNRDVIVWACGGLYTREDRFERFNRVKEMYENCFAVGVKTYCKIDERVIKIRKGGLENE